MPITPAELLSVPENKPWPVTQDAWEELMLAADGASAALVYGVVPGLQASWAGTAAELATTEISTAGGGLADSTDQLKRVHSLLQQFGSAIQDCANELRNIVQRAEAAGLTIDLENGEVGPLWTPHGMTYQPGALRDIERDMAIVMQRANAADEQVAQHLRTLLPREPTQYHALQVAEQGLLTSMNAYMTSHFDASPFTPAQQEEALHNPAALKSMWTPVGQGAAFEPADDQAAAAISGIVSGSPTGSSPGPTSVTPSGTSPYVADMEQWGKAMQATSGGPAPSSGQPAAPDSAGSTPPPGVTPAEWNVT